MKRIVQHFLKNYLAVDAVDEYTEDYEEHATKVADLADMMRAKLKASDKKYFEKDLDHLNYEYLRFDLFSRLFLNDCFQKKKDMRTEIREIFTDILSVWQGPKSDAALRTLVSRLDDAVCCERDFKFKWYINHIASIIK